MENDFKNIYNKLFLHIVVFTFVSQVSSLQGHALDWHFLVVNGVRSVLFTFLSAASSFL